MEIIIKAVLYCNMLVDPSSYTKISHKSITLEPCVEVVKMCLELNEKYPIDLDCLNEDVTEEQYWNCGVYGEFCEAD